MATTKKKSGKEKGSKSRSLKDRAAGKKKKAKTFQTVMKMLGMAESANAKHKESIAELAKALHAAQEEAKAQEQVLLKTQQMLGETQKALREAEETITILRGGEEDKNPPNKAAASS